MQVSVLSCTFEYHGESMLGRAFRPVFAAIATPFLLLAKFYFMLKAAYLDGTLSDAMTKVGDILFFGVFATFVVTASVGSLVILMEIAK